jgi:hypothetical protein
METDCGPGSNYHPLHSNTPANQPPHLQPTDTLSAATESVTQNEQEECHDLHSDGPSRKRIRLHH